ncbi:hypothetical protein G195_004573 [Phytophthora kernoviae 00238/432]|uniref:Uncharacterized protein n=1 Tax=Phytophthora kernoviae 00238/432 TaxID=1284355 RepID=A0A8J4SDH4_9STRA|nr:hypothetical protein G195_004573 [Phytophthora kernoviae 00238/432]
MGSSASTMLHSRPEFSASDIMLDQLEKQVCIEHATNWMEIATRYCTIVLSTVLALLVGNFTVSLDNSKMTPCLVDTACQTDDGDLMELGCDWSLYTIDNKCNVDDDSLSCTTEATDLLSDVESETDEQVCDESDVEDMAWSADEFESVEDSYSSDCEAQADVLMRLTAVVCTTEDSTCPIYLEDYLCTCGECPQYKTIAQDITASKTFWCNDQQRQSITRLLQAFSTYNETVGMRDMYTGSLLEFLAG